MTDQNPAEMVDSYLQFWEDRQDEQVEKLLAPDPLFVFPGQAPMRSLTEVRQMNPRYQWVKKHRDHYAVAFLSDGRIAVTSRGRLYGINLHGIAFQDVRYVDVFILHRGLIEEQHVWNDLLVSGALDHAERQN